MDELKVRVRKSKKGAKGTTKSATDLRKDAHDFAESFRKHWNSVDLTDWSKKERESVETEIRNILDLFKEIEQSLDSRLEKTL